MTEPPTDWLAVIILFVCAIILAFLFTVIFPAGPRDLRAFFSDRPVACQILPPDDCIAYTKEQRK